MTDDPGTDPNHLRSVQYLDGSNLAQRANLHIAYRTAPVSAFTSLTRAIDWSEVGEALDVGCGTGLFWEEAAREGSVRAAAPALTLSDLSAGMVSEAVHRATGADAFVQVIGREADARSLPFGDATFDLVVCTYALYHVPEPATAVAELHRVVRSGGTVVVMTNGPGHLAEIEELRMAVFGDPARYTVNETFSPAFAASLLVDLFDDVSWHRCDDTLRVTDLDDLMAFAGSSAPALGADPALLSEMRSIASGRMAANGGVFEVSKHTGFFLCRRPRR